MCVAGDACRFFCRGSLGGCGALLREHRLTASVNQKTAFYAKECQFFGVDGLRAPRAILLIVDSSLEIEIVVPAFWLE